MAKRASKKNAAKKIKKPTKKSTKKKVIKKASKKQTPKKIGRPSKKDKIDLKQVERLAGLGLIDKEIAYVLGIHRATLERYKKDPEFCDTLKRGKEIADKEVTDSLYKKALGFEHPEEILFQFKGRVIRAKTVKKYAPDTTACIFWLKNRRKDLWRDKNEIDMIMKDFMYKDLEDLTDTELAEELRAIKKRRSDKGD